MTQNTTKEFYRTIFHDDERKIPPSIVEGFFKPEQHLFQEMVTENKSVLEVGCGDGRVLEYLTSKTNQLTGLDYSQRQCNLAKKRVPYAKIVRMDAAKTGFPDESFNYVLCSFNTFGNFPDQETALREMYRITSNSGIMVVNVYSTAALESQLELYDSLDLHVKNIEPDRVVLDEGLVSRRYSKSQLKKLFENAGLEATISELSPIAYSCVVRK